MVSIWFFAQAAPELARKAVPAGPPAADWRERFLRLGMVTLRWRAEIGARADRNGSLP
jgi:hypothetical protein